MSLSFNIAIDGHSSCGKSTIAKTIAKRYGMRYIDTGAMYRAVTYYCMQHNIISNQQVNYKMLLDSLDKMFINFEFNKKLEKSETFLNNINIEAKIRGIEVSERVSIIAQIKEVREKLITIQQEIGEEKNVVMDGRDIGTKVFPNARLKLFITASAEVRAKRRYDELIAKGDDVAFVEILKNVRKRDSHDTNRKINPLLKADDAYLIDNSYLTIEAQNSLVDSLIKEQI